MAIALNAHPLTAGMCMCFFNKKLCVFFEINSIFASLFSLSSTTWNSSGSGNARKEPNRSQYFDGSSDSFDDEDDQDDNEQAISVSSRGRPRKLSSKVRRYFRDQ